MNNRKRQLISRVFSNFFILGLYSLLVFLLMMLDNLGEYLYNNDLGISGAYLFFNTFVYPAGVFLRYLSPCLLFHYAWKLQRKAFDDCSTSVHHNTVIKTVIRCSILCGFCNALSRIIFLAVTSIWFPFIGDIDAMGNFISWPYYDLSLNGNELAHQMFIILFGFLYGAIWGSYAVLCYGKTHSFRRYMIFPFVSQVIWVHICLVLNILPEYRIDLWFYMSEYYQSYGLTALLSFLVVVGSIIITTLLTYGGGNDGQNHRYNRCIAEEKPNV